MDWPGFPSYSYNPRQNPISSTATAQDSSFDHPSQFSADAYKAVSLADHQTLRQLQNQAYLELLNELRSTQLELKNERMISETLKTTVSSLQAAIHGLSTARHLVPEPITATPQTQLIPKLRSAPSAAALDRDDYPDVPFWDELTWSAHEKSRNNVKQLDYLTDEDGQVVGEGRLKEMSSYVRALFNQLLDAGKDPMSWRKHSDEAARYVYSNMLKKYSEFRYCDSDWKIRIFVMIRYREWSKNSRKRPLEVELPVTSKEPSRKKKIHASSVMPASPIRTTVPHNPASPIPATVPINPTFSSVTPASPTTATHTPTSPISTSTTHNPAPSATNSTACNPAHSATPAPPTITHDLNSTITTAAPCSSSISVSPTLTALAPSTVIRSKKTTSIQLPRNPLADVQIPYSQLAPVPLAPSEAPVPVKYIRPNKSSSPKNLYLIEFLQENKLSKADKQLFDEAWTKLSTTTKANFETLSKTHKDEAKHARKVSAGTKKVIQTRQAKLEAMEDAEDSEHT